MATGRKIREGLFLISWKSHRNTSRVKDFGHVQQLDKDIFEICKLTCTEEKSTLQSQIILEVEIVLVKAMKSQKSQSITILATKECTGTGHQTQQKMILVGSKWRTSWFVTANCQNCHHYGNLSSFEILIDFNLFPGGVLQETISKKTRLLNLWKTKTPYDVTIECEGTTFKAHSFILANSSPVLAAMFQHDCKENQKKMVEIKDIRSSVFGQLLHYFYTGDVTLENADLPELMVAADKYAIDSLKEECGQHLSQNLTVENAGEYLVLAHRINCVKLRESSLDFMAKNAKAICSRREEWIEIIKNYPELCFEVMQLMANL